jgi:hypothetical protein
MRDRVRRALEALSRPLELDYLALYPATVLKDHGNMHLDLQPDNPKLPLMTRVPLRVFLPGTYVKVKAGARVLLGFEAADPRRPVAYLWEAGSTLVVEIKTERGAKVRLDDENQKIRVEDPLLVEIDAPTIQLAGGGPAVARVGDQIQVYGVAPGSATATGEIISGSGKTFSG